MILLIIALVVLGIIAYYISSQKSNVKKSNAGGNNITNRSSIIIDNPPSSSPVETGNYCRFCYARLPEDATFCPSCGKKIQTSLEITFYDSDKIKARFREILQRNFTRYNIKEDVPVVNLTGNINDVFKLYKERPNQVYKAEWGRPYDFVLYSGETAVAIIMLGFSNEHSVKVNYLISKMFAKKLNIPYVGFYTKFPNTEEYVVNRIKKQL